MRTLLSLITILVTLSSTFPASAVEVYLFKGAGDFSIIHKNLHFSRGLDSIARTLNDKGIRAEVRGFAQAEEALRIIRKRRPTSVAFVGHSMGALASMALARRMKTEGIRVAYVATLDIPGPIGTAGNNVAWAENYYSMTPVYGLLANTRSHRKAKNVYVFGTHTTMDDSKKVKEGVISAILKINADETGIRPKVPMKSETPAKEMIMALQAEHLVENSAIEAINTRVPIPVPRHLQVLPVAKDVAITPVRVASNNVASHIVHTAKEINRRIASAHLWPSRPINLLNKQ